MDLFFKRSFLKIRKGAQSFLKWRLYKDRILSYAAGLLKEIPLPLGTSSVKHTWLENLGDGMCRNMQE